MNQQSNTIPIAAVMELARYISSSIHEYRARRYRSRLQAAWEERRKDRESMQRRAAARKRRNPYAY